MKMQIKMSFTEEEELWEVIGRNMSNKRGKKERELVLGYIISSELG